MRLLEEQEFGWDRWGWWQSWTLSCPMFYFYIYIYIYIYILGDFWLNHIWRTAPLPRSSFGLWFFWFLFLIFFFFNLFLFCTSASAATATSWSAILYNDTNIVNLTVIYKLYWSGTNLRKIKAPHRNKPDKTKAVDFYIFTSAAMLIMLLCFYLI